MNWTIQQAILREQQRKVVSCLKVSAIWILRVLDPNSKKGDVLSSLVKGYAIWQVVILVLSSSRVEMGRDHVDYSEEHKKQKIGA
jgi:hypothetical protein